MHKLLTCVRAERAAATRKVGDISTAARHEKRHVAELLPLRQVASNAGGRDSGCSRNQTSRRGGMKIDNPGGAEEGRSR